MELPACSCPGSPGPPAGAGHVGLLRAARGFATGHCSRPNAERAMDSVLRITGFRCAHLQDGSQPAPGLLSDSESSKVRNEKIGFVFQSFNLIPDLNLFDNVDVPLRYRGFNSAERKRRIEKVLDTVGLASRMKHLPSQLSGGQQQRVAIARALAGEPRFLLADEPTGNLDSHMAMSVMELISEINRNGTTIIMVTHDPALAEMASRNVHILDGRVSNGVEDSKVTRIATA